jgi:hypothetical protein
MSTIETNRIRHFSRRLLGAAILLAGLVVPQVVLFGPSLVGRTISLPLDLLALDGAYLPRTKPYASVKPFDLSLVDEVFLFEFERRLATEEFRAGRLPLWNPHIYAGAPFVVWDKYSPCNLLYYLFPTPVTLAWMQLVKSVVAGVGAFVFFRRVLSVSFWPAAMGGWCYPLTGFFILWQGFPQTAVTAWLPWMLLAVNGVVRRPLGGSGPALAVLTCLVLITRIDVGAQVLLAAGLFALWCLWHEYGRSLNFRRALAAGVALALAWSIGFLLSAPYLLPFAEYVRSGDRMLRREAGQEERPPGDLGELPRLVLPTAYGDTHRGSWLLRGDNLLESPAATYTGLLATLLLAPLAWCSRRHWPINLFLVFLIAVSLSWSLGLPGFVWLFRRPGLNLLSHNRFVFAASFALLALAVIGLDVLWREIPARRWWFLVPIAVLLVLAVWSAQQSNSLPEPLATHMEKQLRHGVVHPSIPDFFALKAARDRHVSAHGYNALLCCVALIAWALLWFGRAGAWIRPVLAFLLVGELLWFGYGRNPQCDPALYYPRLPLLEQIAQGKPGRVLGLGCLPADLCMSHGLDDIRGYDSIDPRLVIDLLDLVRDPRSLPLPYARVQHYVPVFSFDSTGKLQLPPVLNMLGVRYLIFQGKPPLGLLHLLTAPDYWAVENERALPRAFVPERVEAVPADHLLALLASPDFDPRKAAYVENAPSLPRGCSGTAAVVQETPTLVVVAAEMETPGLVVLADLWYEGWQASIDDTTVPILRTNHAVRGVVVPEGKSTIVFRYEPASLARGVQLLTLGVAIIVFWLAAGWWLRRRTRKQEELTSGSP